MNVLRRPTSPHNGSKMLREAKHCGILPTPHLSGAFKCADCNGVAIEYEHRDYNFPLAVVPICHSCNIKRGSAIAVDVDAARKHNAEITELYRSNRGEYLRRNDAAIMALGDMVKSWPLFAHPRKTSKQRAQQIASGK